MDSSQQTANGSPEKRPKIANANPHNDSVCGNDAPKIDRQTANDPTETNQQTANGIITSPKNEVQPETSPTNNRQTADETQYFNLTLTDENPPVYRLKVYNTEKDRLKAANKSPINDQQIANNSPINRQHNKNDKNDKNIKNDKNDKKEKKDIISFEGADYVYNTSFDYEGLEDEIQDIKFGGYYQLYIQNMGRTGLNRFVKQALLREPQVMRHLVNRGFFVPAGEI